MEDSELTARLIEIQPILHSIARTYFTCREDRQDAVQECMIKAWQTRKQLRSPDAFKSWIIRIMRNGCMDVYRRRIRCIALNEELPDISDDPIKQMIEHDALHSALSQLSPLSRDVVNGRYFEGQSLREMALQYGLSIGTIQSRLYRSLKQLASMITA